MKKKTLALLLTTALCLSLTLSSCSSKKEVCSVDGCSQEVYKDGLCADHYVDAALSEAATSSEADNENIDPAIAAVQDTYQKYIDAAISKLRNSLKNPKSLDIYNIYISDESVSEYYTKNIEIFIDAAAENSFGGTIRSEFYYQDSDFGVKFYECTSDTEKELFQNVIELSTGERAPYQVTEVADGYYHRVTHNKETGEEKEFAYYLHVPEAWYTNS